MKKLLLIATAAAAFCAVSSAEAQSATASKTSRNNSTATAGTTTTGTITRRNGANIGKRGPATPVTLQPSQVDGVVPRLIRSGNPLQMINPFAPASYGDGRDVTRREAGDPYQRPQGIKLATIEF